MDGELKAKWLAALRGGKYLQARGKLRVENGLCCLGVLCKVAKIPISKSGDQCGRNKDYRPIYKLIGVVEASDLMRLNDREQKTFTEIADYVETTL